MPIRIAPSERGGRRVVLVEGTLKAATVVDLERVCLASSSPTTLDLSGLRSADAAGVELLHRLRVAGAELTGVSPYLRFLLERAESRDPLERA